jgi:hypothetical protein
MDTLGGSWPVTRQYTQADPRPNNLRRIRVPEWQLRDAVSTPWRVVARVVQTGGDGEPDVAAAASGYTLLGDATSDVLTYDVAAGYLCVVDELIFLPISDLGYEYLRASIVDGGNAGDASTGRIEQVVNISIPLAVDGSDVVPVGLQAMGLTTIRLIVKNSDPECYQMYEAEMRGRLFDGSQFRGENRR